MGTFGGHLRGPNGYGSKTPVSGLKYVLTPRVLQTPLVTRYGKLPEMYTCSHLSSLCPRARRGDSGRAGALRGAPGRFGALRGTSGRFGALRGTSGRFGAPRGASGHLGALRGTSGRFGAPRGASGRPVNCPEAQWNMPIG